MMDSPLANNDSQMGIVIAILVMGSWMLAVVLGVLEIHPLAGHWVGDVLWAGLTMWLFTGLFITAHDAMHGLVLPKNPRANAWIGHLALTLYAGLSYNRLLAGHIEHHRSPSTEEDPDFWPNGSLGFVGWYLRFMGEYISIAPILVVAVTYTFLAQIVHLNEPRLWGMWLVPQILSSVQLFYFGTYLPHRPDKAYQGVGKTKARSIYYPTWLSLVTCYHFGYHYEHHDLPHVPWWRLPSCVKRNPYSSKPSPSR